MNKLVKENNRIDIDINCDNNLELLNHDYVYHDTLDADSYHTLCGELNELKIYFKDKTYIEVKKKSDKYSISMKKHDNCDKPCEYSFIKDETEYLSQYKMEIDCDIDEISIEYDRIIKELNIIRIG